MPAARRRAERGAGGLNRAHPASVEVLVRPWRDEAPDTDNRGRPGAGARPEALGSKGVQVRPRAGRVTAAREPVEHDEEAGEAPARRPTLQATFDPRQAALIDPGQPRHGALADPRLEPPLAQPPRDGHRGVPVHGVVVPHPPSTALPPYAALTPKRPTSPLDVVGVIRPGRCLPGPCTNWGPWG